MIISLICINSQLTAVVTLKTCKIRMEIADALRLLGVSPRASLAEVKSAYRRLAKQWHPDRCQGQPAAVAEAEEKMKNLNAAYKVALRYVGKSGAPRAKREQPWWWRRDDAPPASARAIRRPAWFRGFQFDHPDKWRDTFADHLGAVAVLAMAFAVAAIMWHPATGAGVAGKVYGTLLPLWYVKELLS